jgi:formamidopyrimidine-DNA glycosylase
MSKIMPELPEVEVTKRGISKVLENSIIKEFIVRYPKLRQDISSEFKTLKNLRVVGITRRAKYILIQTDKGTILIHLGMSGHLLITDKSLPIRKHDHVDIVLSNDYIIRLNDQRRFGLFLWFDKESNPYKSSWLCSLGIEPLSIEFTGEHLFELIKKKNKNIKSVIMDSHIVVGVGNIYASEVLFASRISPLRICSNITLVECNVLVANIKKILSESILKGGTTIRDFSGSDGKPGYFVQNLNVYGHRGEPCKFCGHSIESLVISGRNTFFCPICQN